MTSSEVRARLTGLRLRSRVDTVREVVGRLKGGESAYSLYGGSDAIVAKATALKIRDLLNQGKLSFLPDVSGEVTVAMDKGGWMMQDRDRLGDKDKGSLGMKQDNDGLGDGLQGITEAIRETLGGSRPDTSREHREEWGTEPTIVDAIYALVEAVDRLGKVVSESIDGLTGEVRRL